MNAHGKNAGRHCRRAVPVGAALVLMGGIALAQMSETFDASWSLLPPGGGESNSESHQLVTTLGQTAANASSSEAFHLQSGFLAGYQVIVSSEEPPPDDTSDLWLIH